MTQSQLTLYHNCWSICSIMVRYTLTLRGKAKDATSDIVVKEKEVNIQRVEQLSEAYLCEINPKGQVCASSLCPMVM